MARTYSPAIRNEAGHQAAMSVTFAFGTLAEDAGQLGIASLVNLQLLQARRGNSNKQSSGGGVAPKHPSYYQQAVA